MSIWKLSHGPKEVSEKEHKESISKNVVLVHPETSAKGQSSISQGDLFVKKAKRGDVFYLCRGNDKIVLLGEFTSDEAVESDIKPDFYERSYKLLAEAKPNNGYDSEDKWWTPRNNSTFIKVPEDKHHDFERLIMQPFFNISIEELKIMEEETKHIDYSKNLVEKFRQVIFCGPPGTSKTYFAKRLAASLIGIEPREVDKEEKDNTGLFADNRFSSAGSGQWSIVQFHPSYNYEDFVRGIQISTPPVATPTGSSSPEYNTINKIIAEMADTAIKDKDKKKYVLIIDEINRAHLAAVLGELIYALEYRNCPVDSPYAINGNRQIIIPDNLYIVGTMNTADRSVGHIDYAVRRRFAFVPLLPEKEKCNTEYGRKLFEVVAKLFNKNFGTLSPEFHADDVQPGHTYFMTKSTENACEELALKFTYQVYPLLREYYKDGILIDKSRLDQNGLEISISEPKLHTEVLRKVRFFLGCDKVATVSVADASEEPGDEAPDAAGDTDSPTEVAPASETTVDGSV